MAADSKNGNSPPLADLVADIVPAALALVPGATLPAVAVRVAGKVGLNLTKYHRAMAAVREEAQFDRLLFETAVAIANGNEVVAATLIEELVEDRDFRAKIFATVSKMRESDTDDDALQPLGSLVAVYQSKRPDPSFRNLAAFLCDCSGAEIAAARLLVAALRSHFVSADRFGFTVDFQPNDQVRIGWRGPIGPGIPVAPHSDLSHGRDVLGVVALLRDNGILVSDRPSGALDDIYDPARLWLDGDAYRLLAKVLPPLPAGEKV